MSAITRLWQADADQAHELLFAAPNPAAWNAAALSWLVSQPDVATRDPQPGERIGETDVARVRETTKMFAQLDNRFGGDHSRRSLVHYLRNDATALLQGRYTDQVGRDLFAAVSEAALLAAWASYDSGRHGTAQQYFVLALRLAQSADDKRIACSILSAMSHQATYLGQASEGVNLARAALTGSRTVATATMTAQFQAMEARALARQGDTHGCHRTLAAIETTFGRRDPGQDPEFISYFDQAELSDEFCHCFHDLGQPGPAAQHARQATAGYGAEFRRSDFFATMILASSLADQHEPEQACQAALRALNLGEALMSARCAAYVQHFRDRLARFGSIAAVRDFQEQAAAYRLWTKAA